MVATYNTKLKKKKNRYQRYIAEYSKRRLALKSKFGGTELYRLKVFRINQKICAWKRVLKRIEQTEQKLIDLDEKVMNFLICTSLYHVGPNRSKFNIQKALFYKYGLENGIKAVDLEMYVGVKTHCSAAASTRRNFTNSFKTNKENKDTWQRFLLSIRQHSN